MKAKAHSTRATDSRLARGALDYILPRALQADYRTVSNHFAVVYMRVLGLIFGLCLMPALQAADSAETPESLRYHLSARDLIRVSVFGEPDLTVERRIDGNGTLSLPLLGSIRLQGLTVPSAEEAIRKLYIEKEIFVHPQISVAVLEYVRREISVLGQVKEPGKIVLPIETESIDIVDAITKAGGITRIGRSDSVRVTRKNATADDKPITVDVQRMLTGLGGSKTFMVFAGDVIFVPERIL